MGTPIPCLTEGRFLRLGEFFFGVRDGKTHQLHNPCSHSTAHHSSHSTVHRSSHLPFHPSSHSTVHPSSHLPFHPSSHSTAHHSSHSTVHPSSHLPFHRSSHSTALETIPGETAEIISLQKCNTCTTSLSPRTMTEQKKLLGGANAGRVLCRLSPRFLL
jgi:hypothetical protein